MQKLSTSPEDLKVGGTIIVVEIWNSIGPQDILKIGKNSKTWSSKQKEPFLTSKYKKSQIKKLIHDPL